MNQPFGKYTLVSRLGGGGMAEVFKAVLVGISGFEKHFALKLILPGFSSDSEFVRMFTHEATLAAQLDHANIVKIYEFDVVDGRHYIAMELVDGQDLRSVLKRCAELDTRLTVEEVALVGLEICKGLSFAHGELSMGKPKIIHRDVSPHNIMLSRAGEVKITDFGIAKLETAAKVTQTGTVKGKFAYMSPEQARAEQLDRRSDVFSLGCVLWELLNQRRLFSGSSDIDTLEKLQNAVIDPPSANNPDVPAEMDKVVLGALERDRSLRTPSASVLGRQLEQVLRGSPGLDRARVLPELFERLFAGMEAGGGGTSKLILDETADHQSEKPATVPAMPGALAVSQPEPHQEASKAATDPSFSLSIDVEGEDQETSYPPPVRSRRWRIAGVAAGATALVAATVGITMALSPAADEQAKNPDASVAAQQEEPVVLARGPEVVDKKVADALDAGLHEADAGVEVAAKVEKPKDRPAAESHKGSGSSKPAVRGKTGRKRQKKSRGRFAKNAALANAGSPKDRQPARRNEVNAEQARKQTKKRGAGFYKAGVTMVAKDDPPKLVSGSVVKAKLTKDLRSDSEGAITARVARQVRTSGGALLLATGALLTGRWLTKGQTFVVDFTSSATDDREISFAGKATIPGKRVRDDNAEGGWLLEVGAGTVFDVRVK